MATDPGHHAENQTSKEIAHDMVGQLQALQNTDTLTDFEITCGGQSWKVHRLVLAMHSKVLLKACGGGFKEAHEQKLDLSAHDAADVGRLVAFMYTLEYNCDGVDAVQEMVSMYVIADKYNIDSLKRRALAEFRADLESWNLIFFEDKSAIVCRIICETYEAAAQPLCDLINSRIIANEVLAHGGDAAKEILNCVEAIPEFARDLVAAMSKQGRKEDTDLKYPGEKRYSCPACSTTFKMRMERSERHEDRYLYYCPDCGRAGAALSWSASVIVD